MSWVLELTPDQAYEKARRTVVDGCAEDVVDILDQTSLDISARGLARRGLVLEAIHELAADRLMPDGLYENITKHL